MQEPWLDSFGPNNDPLPYDQRNEAMFMVTVTQSGIEITQLPPGPETSSCKFDMSEAQLTSNIIALIHTHPYSDGDIITDPGCEKEGLPYNANSVSDGDQEIVEAMINSTILPPTPMYVIDKDKIRVIDPSNPSEYAETINRCGY